ncbi:hypothetical protein ACFE04_002375 [Oxalis oulophora]
MKNLNGVIVFTVLLILVFVYVSTLGNLNGFFVSITPSSSVSSVEVPETQPRSDESPNNSSVPPNSFTGQDQLDIAKQGFVEKDGLMNNNSTEEINPIDEPDVFEIEQGGSKVFTDLEKIEANLHKSRASIKEASFGNQTDQDPDYVPTGPMYRNSKAFHRSYLEMEKNFKVFVYEEGDAPVFHHGPCKSIYSSEGTFIYEIEKNSQFRTRDASKAQVYFLPFSVARLVRYVHLRDSHSFGPIKTTVIDYVDLISRKYPYWNRSLAADHFMLACHDWGPETSFAIPYLQKNAIRALCNANTSEKFNPAKDVSIPEINLIRYQITELVGGPSPSKRPLLAFFAGGNHGPVRPVVFEHWLDKDPDIEVHSYLPQNVSYYSMLRKSKYCLCPSGYEVASPRIVEAIYTGCVPVLISDHYVPPFSDVLDWKSFSVEVPVSEVPNLKKILEGISTRRYLTMQRRVLKIRRHFEFNSPPKRFDVFHMILHSIWLRRLNVKIVEEQGQMK